MQFYVTPLYLFQSKIEYNQPIVLHREIPQEHPGNNSNDFSLCSKLTGRPQAIIGTNAGILLIRILGTHFSEILIAIKTFSFKKMHLNVSSAK